MVLVAVIVVRDCLNATGSVFSLGVRLVVRFCVVECRGAGESEETLRELLSRNATSQRVLRERRGVALRTE